MREGAGEGAEFVGAGGFGEMGVEVAGGNVLGLGGQGAERFHFPADDAGADQEHQEKAQQSDEGGHPPEVVEAAEDVPLGADQAHAPAGGLERRVEDVTRFSIDL